MSVSVGELRNGLSRFLNRAAYGGERIVVTSRGNPKAAVISYEDLQLFEDLLNAHGRDRIDCNGEFIQQQEIWFLR